MTKTDVFDMLNEKVRELVKQRFKEPTEVQRLAIPEIIKGKNVLVIAGTGSGKTESVMLPLFSRIVFEGSEHRPISILYINPLRSLSRDLLDRMMWWSNKLELEIAVRHGDTTQRERAVQAEIPPILLFTTPETLQALLVGKKMREHLKNVRYVVIDEIHELCQSKRGVQLSIALERLAEIAGNFQRIGLSATVGSPEVVAKFLAPDTKIIHAEVNKNYDINVECPKPSHGDQELSDSFGVSFPTVARLRRLYELIQSSKSVLAFTNTRETAEVLSSRLRRLDRELKQEVHHGSLSKERRIKSEQKFKAQELKSLIATSSLELGIDIGSIDLVVQYLSPRQVSKLIQRVGRAGHRLGEVSRGIILSGDEDLFESAIIAGLAMKKDVEKIVLHEMPMDVLATQIAGLVLEYPGISEEKIYRIVRRAYPFREITKQQISELLKFMADIRLVYLERGPLGYKVNRSRKIFDYYFGNLSMIPDTVQYRVVSIIEGEPIGNLDEEFIAEHGRPGEKFVCSGRAWKIIQVDGLRVTVEPIEDIESAIPVWEGELIPVPFDVAQGVGRLRRFISDNLGKENIVEIVKGKYSVDSASVRDMMKLIEKQREKHVVPDDKTILIESHEDFVVIHLCCGSLVNDTIGRYLAALLTAKTGIAVNMKSDPYRIMLQTKISPEEVRKLLQESSNVEEVLTLALGRSSLFRYRFIHVAKRMGVLSKKTQYEKINMPRIIAQYENTPVWNETMNEVFHDKLDIANAVVVLDNISKGRIKVVVQTGLSPLGELGLIHQFAEIIRPALPEEEIFNAFKRRLMKTRIRLLCVSCAGYNVVKEVRDVDEQPECPKCSSRLIAVLRRNQEHVADIVKMRLKKKELNEADMKEFQIARRTADLVIVYGKKAVIALAGHGVGPETAARILSRLHPTKELFFRDILEAEKTFARTKPYWE